VRAYDPRPGWQSACDENDETFDICNPAEVETPLDLAHRTVRLGASGVRAELRRVARARIIRRSTEVRPSRRRCRRTTAWRVNGFVSVVSSVLATLAPLTIPVSRRRSA
jgi:hypothetical protein